MGIKHKTPKASDEPGYASEWNDEHVVDSDVNFNGYSGENVGEPISPSDIATKNYVDSTGVPGGIADELGGTWQQENFTGSLPNNTTITIVNYSGSGWLFFIKTSRHSSGTHQIIITIDGIVYLIIPSIIQWAYTSLSSAIYSGLKKFNSSLKVEIQDLSESTRDLSVNVCYSIL